MTRIVTKGKSDSRKVVYEGKRPPSVDSVLSGAGASSLLERFGRVASTNSIRAALGDARGAIRRGARSTLNAIVSRGEPIEIGGAFRQQCRLGLRQRQASWPAATRRPP